MDLLLSHLTNICSHCLDSTLCWRTLRIFSFLPSTLTTLSLLPAAITEVQRFVQILGRFGGGRQCSWENCSSLLDTSFSSADGCIGIVANDDCDSSTTSNPAFNSFGVTVGLPFVGCGLWFWLGLGLVVTLQAGLGLGGGLRIDLGLGTGKIHFGV